MSRDMLSQDEIDALLKQNNLEDTDDDTADGEILPDIDEILSPLEQDALGEIGNITFGSAATALSSLLGQKVDITTPKVGAISREAVQNEFPQPYVAVHVEYTEGFEGINLLVIQTRDAQIIADLMMGGDGTAPTEELSDLHLSAVQEAMNQMMGSAATSMSTIFNKLVNISPPGIDLLDLPQGQGVENFPQEEVLVKISFRLKVGDLIDSNIMQLIPVSFARAMVNMLLGGTDEVAQDVAVETPPASAPAQTPEPAQNGAMAASPAQTGMGVPPSTPAAAYPPVNDPAAYPQQPVYQQPMYQQPYPQQPMYQQPMYPPQQPQYAQAPSGFQQPPMNVQPVQFSSFDNGSGPQGTPQNLGMLMDIPLQVTVELGRTRRQIKDILDLSPGSIIELDKLAGEPVDILVNNKLIAKGEVVVIDENFGVRVTDIISQFDRVQKLQ
ncbi:flagellar motor switch phosphatase FliY [Aneurinibacillus sp. Ricciae_BoGa-3]|uniref:flagellar motor switch phosphatase FliY n=1 Tax=Aneurinibacillus sp. Ricciae_BoGa-3 TaxID=3022697 RepID=UPI0023408A5B|nr:flagellar motor switch phosphatase FliY [Aneurinibacillus sp. Ricciae_BoGa-3]WCK52888.1 flagellar motor switch phosphatase FliY [Aneurinibacillus sp. Ricciae_BoGa-3]